MEIGGFFKERLKQPTSGKCLNGAPGSVPIPSSPAKLDKKLLTFGANDQAEKRFPRVRIDERSSMDPRCGAISGHPS
jgi:hypothetical protein